MVKSRRQRNKPPAWTPFERARLAPEHARVLAQHNEQPDEIWVNSRYEVWLFKRVMCTNPGALADSTGWPEFVVHLSIKRRDKEIIRDWREMQRIKNEIMGAEVEACELFPAESRLVDEANQYHLFCLPSGFKFPFGYVERCVSEGSTSVAGSRPSKQRPFKDDVPPEVVQEKEKPDGV